MAMLAVMALAAVWVALLCFVMGAACLVYPPAFTNAVLVFLLELGAPLSLTFAFLVLWAHRKSGGGDPAVAAQRQQAWVAIAMSLLAVAIIYFIVFGPYNRAAQEAPRSALAAPRPILATASPRANPVCAASWAGL